MSGDPVRLIDEPTTAALLRADLGHGAAAMVSGLDVAGGAARLGAAILAEPTVAATAAGTGVATKLLLGLALVGGAAALWAGFGRPTSAVEPDVAAPASQVASTPAIAELERRREPMIEPAVQPAVPKIEPPATAPELAATVVEEPAVEEPRRVEERKASKKPAAAEPSFDDAARREAMLVGDAKKALRTGDGARVLELVARADDEFPKGQLVQERRALEIRALAQLGRADEASSKADQFLARYPASPYADAVERAVER